MNKNQYDILQSVSGDILIIIGKRDSEPHNPKMYYNGDDLLCLQRNDNDTVIIENLDNDVKEAFNQVGCVLIVEIEDEDIVCEYNVGLRIVKNLAHYIVENKKGQ